MVINILSKNKMKQNTNTNINNPPVYHEYSDVPNKNFDRNSIGSKINPEMS